MDKHFRVEVLSATPDPQQVVYAAMHTDYSEEFVFDELHWVESRQYAIEEVLLKKPVRSKVDTFDMLSESQCGEIAVKQLLKGGRGHYGPLEHPQIIFNCGWFPHSTMQQIRTHRVGISMDVQSGRYTGNRICNLATALHESGFDECVDFVDSVFYLRPAGDYTDREGKRYTYTESMRLSDLDYCAEFAVRYQERINQGFSEEHARGLIPFDVRQHWVLSLNLRSLMHLLLIRGKRDAQLECQQLCELILPHFKAWTPQIYEWFEENLWLKGRLAP